MKYKVALHRSEEGVSVSVPVRALISYPLQVYPPDSCPLCQQEIPVTTPGATVGERA